MSNAEIPAPSRGRVTRAKADTERRARRYDPSVDEEGIDTNLWVDTTKLDPQFQYRWVNVTKNRVQRLHKKDWDQVSEEEIGFSTERHADIAPGAREDTRAILMRKYKDWFEEDQAAKQGRIDEQMRRAARGEEMLPVHGAPESDGAGVTRPSDRVESGLSAKHAYLPQGKNEL